MSNFFETIKQIPLFKTISETDWDYIFSISHIYDYGKNEIIHLQNDTCLGIDVILSGVVSVQHLDVSGNSMTISDFNKGDILGVNILFSSKPFYPMTILSKQPSKIIRLNKTIVLKLCKENDYFLDRFLNEICDKTLFLTGKINNIAMKSIRQCIVELLIKERTSQKTSTIIIPFSKKEWAETLGIQRPSLSRELSNMQREGFIKVDNRKIQILNLGAFL